MNSSKTDVDALVIRLRKLMIIPVVITAFGLWHAYKSDIEDARALKELNARAVVSPSVDPVTYATVQELYDAYPRNVSSLHYGEPLPEDVDFNQACSMSPGGCLLNALIESKGGERSRGHFRPLEASYLRDPVEKAYVGICRGRGSSENGAFIFSHTMVMGDPVQAFMKRIAMINQRTHQAPQFLAMNNPVAIALTSNMGVDLRQPDLGAGFDTNPPLAFFDFEKSQIWIALQKTLQGYVVVTLSNPKTSFCLRRERREIPFVIPGSAQDRILKRE